MIKKRGICASASVAMLIHYIILCNPWENKKTVVHMERRYYVKNVYSRIFQSWWTAKTEITRRSVQTNCCQRNFERLTRITVEMARACMCVCVRARWLGAGAEGVTACRCRGKKILYWRLERLWLLGRLRRSMRSVVGAAVIYTNPRDTRRRRLSRDTWPQTTAAGDRNAPQVATLQSVREQRVGVYAWWSAGGHRHEKTRRRRASTERFSTFCDLLDAIAPVRCSANGL